MNEVCCLETYDGGAETGCLDVREDFALEEGVVVVAQTREPCPLRAPRSSR